jgi:DNA modification methylase
MVAEQEGRNAILIELNPEYMELAKQRTMQTSLLAA